MNAKDLRTLLTVIAGAGMLACGRPATAPTAAAEMQGHQHHGGHHRFENAEEWAKHFDDPKRDAWQRPEAVLDVLALREDSVVADIGAGTGYFTVRLAKRVPNGVVVASDIEPDMVRYLRERAAREGLPNVHAVQGRGGDAALDREIDAVLMCDVYHHIEDPVAMFTGLRARLRPGGKIVIVDFDPAAPAGTPGPPTQMRVSADRVAEQLAAAGLVEVERHTSLLPYQYILVLEAAPTGAAATR